MTSRPGRRLGRANARGVPLTTTEWLAVAVIAVGVPMLVAWVVAMATAEAPRARLAVFVAVLLACALAMTLGYLLVRRRRRRRETETMGLATEAEARAQSGEQRARDKAVYQRPSMTAHQIAAADLHQLAMPLGRSVSGTLIYALMEDQIVCIGKTGSGKGANFVAPAVLTAPGPVVVTTTRPDIIDVIAKPRGQQGRVWVFDPLQEAAWPQPMFWDPVAGAEQDTVARSRGRAFAAGVKTGNGAGNTDFFKDSAAGALQYLIHAAALSKGSMRDVAQWAMNLNNGAERPRDIIRSSTHPRAERLWADMLGSLATGADDTVASTRVTLRTALDAISSGTVLDCLIDAPERARFDVTHFLTSSDTLVLVSDSNSLTNVAPLTTMLLQEIIDVAKQVAKTKPRNLLDPPLRIVGDEIANVAPLEKLPEVVTDSRGYGFQWFLFFQSRTQPESIWGKARAATLFTQAAFELVLPGIKDPDTLEHYSKLLGTVDVSESSLSTTAAGTWGNATFTTREHRAMRPEEVRKLGGEGTALLMPALGEPMLLHLTPWWERKDGPQLSQGAADVAALRSAYAARLRQAAQEGTAA